jgi:hypothetical protein
MMPHGENWGAPSVIAAFAGFDRESTASYERNDDNDCYYGSVHSPVPSRIKKTPASRAGIFLYATKTNRALGVSGDGGKRPTGGYFGPATILNLYRIAHSESTVDKWNNSPSVKL